MGNTFSVSCLFVGSIFPSGITYNHDGTLNHEIARDNLRCTGNRFVTLLLDGDPRFGYLEHCGK